ncbi:helix-turn-helix domain-containing protein [Domibacillus sp. A3M-37]|uniref:helix-turn-helix transcriptional regulator n=1 Tax=Domibacillus TaxID=1433999 RepID=UPI000AE686CA|nr:MULTISPECIES: helix-turn-helix domain-containing protein [Domibacillus]MCP3761538.1 helix-turn-helix domain-containing protein [Domibacillus sp. A3M-37]
MKKDNVIDVVSSKFKLIRTERGYTQDKMAEVIGLSKKTLVQIEKERILAGWTTTAAVCALFRDSDILQSALGGDPVEIAELAAHDTITRPQRDKTMGGRVWWRELDHQNGFRLQQNMISGHYRVLDADAYRLFSTYDVAEAEEHFQEYIRRVQF